MSQQDLGTTEKAKETAKEVAGEVGTQAKVVAGEAKQQLTEFVDRAKEELRQTSTSKGQEMASGLRTWGDQLAALAEGRPEQAGQMRQYADQARQRITSFADRLEQGGPQALFTDVAAFARRRPGLFLLGAAGAGFVIGRVVRGSAAVSADGQTQTYAQRYGTVTDATLPGYTTGATAKVGNGEVWS